MAKGRPTVNACNRLRCPPWNGHATQGPAGDQGREPSPFLGPSRRRRGAGQSGAADPAHLGRRARRRPGSTSLPPFRSPSPTSPISAGWCRTTRRTRASSPRSSGWRTSCSPICSTARRTGALCSCSIRSPIRTMSARSCARRPRSARSASSPRTGTPRPNPARSPRRPRARWRQCPGCASSILPARWTTSPRRASGGSG